MFAVIDTGVIQPSELLLVGAGTTYDDLSASTTSSLLLYFSCYAGYLCSSFYSCACDGVMMTGVGGGVRGEAIYELFC